MDKLRRYWNRPEHCAYLFIAPALFLLVVFRIIPTAISFACSLFDIDMFLNGKGFIGLANCAAGCSPTTTSGTPSRSRSSSL